MVEWSGSAGWSGSVEWCGGVWCRVWCDGCNAVERSGAWCGVVEWMGVEC